MKPIFYLLIIAIFCGTPELAFASKLQKVWEVDLRKSVYSTNGLPEFPVFALRFSPDGRKLAVIADIYSAHGGRKSRLLVSDIDHPPSKFMEFEVEFGILQNGRGSALNFGWAPSSEIVYAAGKVVHLVNGTTCDLPNQSVFISDDVAMSSRGVPPSGNITSTHIVFYNENCRERGQWDVQESWLVSDVSTDRGLISVQRYFGSTGQPERLIVDPLRRKVLQRWLAMGTSAWVDQFADGGRAICGGGFWQRSNRQPAVCRNVDTGKETVEALRGNGVDPIETASRATRVVVSDYRRKIPLPFDFDDEIGIGRWFFGRVVWDFGTGHKVASWHAESQTYPNVFSPPKQITEPFQFAMSPNGEYVAEGGNGILRLYKIEP